jgi:shikimate kinase
MRARRHIILIGMPGSGKSSLGRCLAARLGLRFVDTDHLIEAGEGLPLGEILKDRGLLGFIRLEARCVQDIAMDGPPMVIATGGSVVYSERAMGHLKSAGWVVFLDLTLAELHRRLGDLAARGVVIGREKSLADLFVERRPLYLKHADLVYAGAAPTPAEDAAQLAQRLKKKGVSLING